MQGSYRREPGILKGLKQNQSGRRWRAGILNAPIGQDKAMFRSEELWKVSKDFK